MQKLLLMYVNSDLYEYGKMKLQVAASGDDEINHYKPRFLKSFQDGKYSELHYMTMHLDPANGVTTMVENEYLSIPLKTKTIINAVAKSAQKTSSQPTSMDLDEMVEEDELESP